MTTYEMINAICEELLYAEGDCLNIIERKQPISAYGPVVAVRKCFGQPPFEVMVQDGPEDFFWIELANMPDWGYVVEMLYRATRPEASTLVRQGRIPVRQGVTKKLKCRVVNF